MKVQIRRGVFETNSSSTHSLVITTQDDFTKWKNGEVYLDKDTGDFVDEDYIVSYAKDSRWIDTDGKTNEEILEEVLCDEYRFCTYSNYGDGYEYFDESFTSPSGDDMIAFGYFGYDG